MDERVPLVTSPFRSFLHLADDGERLAVLRAAHELLLPGGRLAFDVFEPSREDIEATQARWLEREPGIFERADWDEVARTLTLSVRGEDGATTMQLAWISPREWSGLIERGRPRGRGLLRLVRPAALRGRRGLGLGRPPPGLELLEARHGDPRPRRPEEGEDQERQAVAERALPDRERQHPRQEQDPHRDLGEERRPVSHVQMSSSVSGEASTSVKNAAHIPTMNVNHPMPLTATGWMSGVLCVMKSDMAAASPRGPDAIRSAPHRDAANYGRRLAVP